MGSLNSRILISSFYLVHGFPDLKLKGNLAILGYHINHRLLELTHKFLNHVLFFIDLVHTQLKDKLKISNLD